MLVIRLLRTGKKNQPSFKIVVTQKENPPRGGRFVEQVGTYNPLTKEKLLKKERIQYWLSKGAQLSHTLHNLLVSEKILEGSKIAVHNKPKGKPAAVESSGEAKPAEASKVEEKEKPKEEPKPGESPKEEPQKEEKREKPKEEEKKSEEGVKKEDPPKEESPQGELKPEEKSKEGAQKE